MSDIDGSTTDLLGIVAIFLLVFANGFFVAAEFSLVAVRRSRVAELVAQRRTNATALQRAVDHLDANLAATQLGITISSLALGWIGEPALAHLIEPLLAGLPGAWAATGAHAIALTIAFSIITTLHIVLGELAPKSLALQRSEGTALWVVRPLGLFLFLLRPAILLLNGLGNQLLKLAGLRTGTGEEFLHSPEELKMLITASGRAGLLHEVQREVVERIFNIGHGRMLAADAFNRLQIRERPERGDFHTLAGFALFQLGRIPATGDHFNWEGWSFEVIDMDDRRIDKMLVRRATTREKDLSAKSA